VNLEVAPDLADELSTAQLPTLVEYLAERAVGLVIRQIDSHWWARPSLLSGSFAATALITLSLDGPIWSISARITFVLLYCQRYT